MSGPHQRAQGGLDTTPPFKEKSGDDYTPALPFTSVSTELRAVDILLGPIPVGAAAQRP
jgi:hypothetical protein